MKLKINDYKIRKYLRHKPKSQAHKDGQKTHNLILLELGMDAFSFDYFYLVFQRHSSHTPKRARRAVKDLLGRQVDQGYLEKHNEKVFKYVKAF